tara:strand:+ start:562 stop:1767 length:1206 start_codon:yes stop_codon:yes gene_type:complete
MAAINREEQTQPGLPDEDFLIGQHEATNADDVTADNVVVTGEEQPEISPLSNISNPKIKRFKLKINDEKNISKYCVANYTALHNYKTRTGDSKNQEYLQIEGVPCIVTKYDSKSVTLNAFTSAKNRQFTISREDFNRDFMEINPDSDGNLHLDAYPIPINISEFDMREEVNSLEKEIKKILVNEKVDKRLKKIIDDKLFQLIQSQGAPYITIAEYYKFKNGEITLSPHKRFGNEIFNRNCRWCPPVDITYDNFKNSKSYPAPLGIRPKDFCLPSELIITINGLINQILNFEGIDDVSFEETKKIIPSIHKKEHTCKYCGEKINIHNYSSQYKSCENYIEICHRNPNDRFLSRNMYWGHGDCNRRQGGYSETDRMNDGIRLMLINGIIDKETYESLSITTQN